MNTYSWKKSVAFLLLAASSTAADENLQKAFELELAGQNSERSAIVSRVAADSGDSAAHWMNGEIRVGDQWVPYHRVADQGDRWAQLHRYREERAKRQDTLEDQQFLADGCQHHGMLDEERAHLQGMISTAPEHPEARQRLGDQKIQGVWVTSEEARNAERIVTANRAAFQKWNKVLDRPLRNLSDRSEKRRDAARTELAAIRDPAAIPVLEERLGKGNEAQQLEYLTWVRGVSSWKAAASMAHLAVFSESAKVRIEATKELKNRRLEEYAPTILNSMVTPVSVRSTLQSFGPFVLYSRHEFHESQNRQLNMFHVVRFGPEYARVHYNLHVLLPIRGQISTRLLSSSPEVTVQDSSKMAEFAATRLDQELSVKNSEISHWNDRCGRVLVEVTGLEGVNDPVDWWAWWQDDQGYSIDRKDQVFASYQEDWYLSRRGISRQRGLNPNRFVKTFSVGSCFVAGTPVMTEYGSKPIESIVRGDRVLSQDIETGELAFQPVYRTTKRISPDSSIIKFGGEQLTCTPRHPFWVNGKGWRMARELEPGDRFHSVTGSVDVSGVDTADKVEVFNLEVGDFHTYFVGQNPVLTHDVTVRQPTDKLLPGYEAPLTAALK